MISMFSDFGIFVVFTASQSANYDCSYVVLDLVWGVKETSKMDTWKYIYIESDKDLMNLKVKMSHTPLKYHFISKNNILPDFQSIFLCQESTQYEFDICLKSLHEFIVISIINVFRKNIIKLSYMIISHYIRYILIPYIMYYFLTIKYFDHVMNFQANYFVLGF